VRFWPPLERKPVLQGPMPIGLEADGPNLFPGADFTVLATIFKLHLSQLMDSFAPPSLWARKLDWKFVFELRSWGRVG